VIFYLAIAGPGFISGTAINDPDRNVQEIATV
jgi:hypothetical protein